MPATLPSLLVLGFLSLACLSDAFRVRRKRKTTNNVRVGALGGHGPTSWSGDCNQSSDTSLERAQCNLNVYAEAARTAQSAGVDLLVLPEYGLINGGGHAEVTPAIGEQPCGLEGSAHAQVSQLSCLAREYSVALASNIITSKSGNQFITTILYDKNGTVQSVYDKNRLFPGEGSWATAGAFNPTVVELFGQKWGLCICYEGMDPFAGWAQFHSFRDQGAQNVIWNVGNTGFGSVFTGSARDIAGEVQMNVIGAMNKAMLWGATTALVGRDRRDLPRTTANLNRDALSPFGYRASPFIHYTTV